MKISLKNGLLTVAMSKPEVKKLHDAIELCKLVSMLSPVDPQITDSASGAVDELGILLSLSVKEEGPRPLLDLLESKTNEVVQ